MNHETVVKKARIAPELEAVNFTLSNVSFAEYNPQAQEVIVEFKTPVITLQPVARLALDTMVIHGISKADASRIADGLSDYLNRELLILAIADSVTF